MNEVSIFKRVLINNLKIVMIPIILIMLLIGYFITDRVKTDKINETKIEVSKYAQSIQVEIEEVMSMIDNTTRYPLIYKGLNREYENYFDAFTFINDVTFFLDNFTFELKNSTISVCFDNDTLFEGKYFTPASKFQGYEQVLKQFENEKTNLIWEDEIYIDTSGREYIKFYKEMSLNEGCFVIGKLCLPGTTENIKVIKKHKESDDYSEISTSINEYFEATSSVNKAYIYISCLQIYGFLILITVLLFILLFYTTQKTTEKVTRDINDFISQLYVIDVSDEKLDLEIKSGESKELSIIKETISRLLAQINEITNSKYNTEMEKQSLEFELLQSQIDPHTLYNSLSAIRLGAFKRNDTEMVDFVDTMVSYYRKVLNKGKTISRIFDELDLITKYVKINELSHYKKYNLHTEISDEVANNEILHLLLQPFVENAIIHGLCGSKKDCEIKVVCREENGFINIVISDNGRGMNKETLNKLNNIDKYEIGYGIKNACMRLKLFYGADATVRFESEQGRGTDVYLSYPI